MRDQAGQSVIEFLVTFVFSLGLLFIFVYLGLNFARGYMVHYATYQASRAYLTLDSTSLSFSASDDYAARKAREVFESFQLERLGISDLELFAIDVNSATKYEYVGMQARFKLPFTPFKAIGGSQPLELTSDSFLGREPIRSNCLKRVCYALQNAASGSSLNFSADATCQSDHITAFDNGC